MASLLSKNPLAKMIVEGDPDADMLNMLLQKQLPFTETEYLETFVFIIKKAEHKQAAVENIKNISDRIKKDYVENPDLNVNVAYYILLESLSRSKNEILVKIIQNNHLPIDFLKKIALQGNKDILEVLSENQIRLIAFPEIIDIMEQNHNINQYTKGKLDEIKRFYLTNEKAEEIKADSLTDDIFTIAAMELKENTDENQKKEKADKKNTEIEEEDEDEALLIEDVEQKVMARFQEINNMTVAERIKTALLGTQADRAMLIRDPNKLVSLAVIQSPKLSLDEIVTITKNKSIAGDIISKIAKKKSWTKSYQVVLALVANPKTPVSEALGFLKKLHDNDLKMIKKDKNVNPVVRKLATQIQIQKG